MLIILRDVLTNQIEIKFKVKLFFVTALSAADFDTFFSISAVFCHFLVLFWYHPVTVIFQKKVKAFCNEKRVEN